jgi:LPXTG-motif cell wall-anchored protein
MKKTMLFLAVFGVAAMVWAQLPTSQQSAAPTSNSFRIMVMEPQEGATIQGPDFNIVLRLPTATPPGTAVSPDERKATLTPTYQIWIDGKNYGNLPIGQNVLNVAGVPTGPHKIVIAAKNTAGELIDRKEFTVTTTEPVVAQAQPTQMTREPAPAPAPASVPPPVVETAPAPAPPAPIETSLPHTGSAYPLAALAGLLLLGAGIALRRYV